MPQAASRRNWRAHSELLEQEKTKATTTMPPQKHSPIWTPDVRPRYGMRASMAATLKGQTPVKPKVARKRQLNERPPQPIRTMKGRVKEAVMMKGRVRKVAQN